MREEFKDVDYPDKGQENVTFALDDYTFVKYLRARDFDVARAQKILHENVEWRRRYRPHELTFDQPGIVREVTSMGKSKSGHIVLTYKIATYEPSRYTVEDYLRSRVCECEMVKRDMARDGWRVDRYIMIADVRGFSVLKHPTPHSLRMVKQLMDMIQSLYRESVERIIIYQGPAIFQKFWSLIKIWIKPETAKRVLFLSEPRQLLEFMEPDQIFEE